MDKASKIARKSLVLSMDRIIRSINCEIYIEQWLMSGVADGELDNNSTIDDVDDFYIQDDEFKILMDVFSKLVDKAIRNGGFYCDGIISKQKVTKWEW